MKFTFLGTRGYVDASSKKHRRHTATLIIHRGKKIMLDCGQDWLNFIWHIKPDAVVLTHAHPDHAEGLKYGAPCPVYATRDTWRTIKDYLIDPATRFTIKRNTPFILFGVKIQAVSVVHSLIAPAVSYRIGDGKVTVFYSGDIAYIPRRVRALRDVRVYIGDASTVFAPLIRKKNDLIYGHASVRTQLTWCQKSGVPIAIFTHCGTSLIVNDGRSVAAKIALLGRQRGVKALVAYDGMRLHIES